MPREHTETGRSGLVCLQYHKRKFARKQSRGREVRGITRVLSTVCKVSEICFSFTIKAKGAVKALLDNMYA
jgi:hypothetical protein